MRYPCCSWRDCRICFPPMRLLISLARQCLAASNCWWRRTQHGAAMHLALFNSACVCDSANRQTLRGLANLSACSFVAVFCDLAMISCDFGVSSCDSDPGLTAISCVFLPICATSVLLVTSSTLVSLSILLLVISLQLCAISS